MYVCVCHAVTEDDVRDHVSAGACSAKAVRAACGMRPGCGSCVQRICALLAECTVAQPVLEVAQPVLEVAQPALEPVERPASAAWPPAAA